MSKFECAVVRVTIEPHPNADAIELAVVGGYTAIVQKGRFKTGDLAVYIPEQALLPEWLLKEMGFWDDMNGKGKLSGSAGNRVKAMKLRGVLSQGLVIPTGFDDEGVCWVGFATRPGGAEATVAIEGRDVAEFLGVTKYEPKVPAQMAGRAAGGDLDATISYDFENIKKQPSLFDEGMDVVITEKIHGTLLMVGLIPKAIWEGKPWADKCPSFGDYKGVVSSKGNAKNGILLDPTDEGNLYVGMASQLWLQMYANVKDSSFIELNAPIFLFGEIFGQGIQDLGYGQKFTQFRAFDVYIGTRSQGGYLTPAEMTDFCFGTIPMVPRLYTGPYSLAKVQELTNGNTTVLDFAEHAPAKQIREGVVICAADGSSHPRFGRRKAKSVSAAYLLRKGETTEFQ